MPFALHPGTSPPRRLPPRQGHRPHAYDRSGTQMIDELSPCMVPSPCNSIPSCNHSHRSYLTLPKCSEQGEKDDKIIAVCADDPEYRHYNDISELSPHRLQEIRRFFEDCTLSCLTAPYSLNFRGPCWTRPLTVWFLPDKKNENKEVAVNDFLPAAAAREAIQYSM